MVGGTSSEVVRCRSLTHLVLKRLIVLEVPSLEAARAFYDSPEYQPVKAIRLQRTASDIALVVRYDDVCGRTGKYSRCGSPRHSGSVTIQEPVLGVQ